VNPEVTVHTLAGLLLALSDPLFLCRTATGIDAALFADDPPELESGDLLGSQLRDFLKRKPTLSM